MENSTLETLFWVSVIGFFLMVIYVMPLTGIGTPRGKSTYTGYIVDTEIDKGYLFRPSTDQDTLLRQ